MATSRIGCRCSARLERLGSLCRRVVDTAHRSRRPKGGSARISTVFLASIHCGRLPQLVARRALGRTSRGCHFGRSRMVPLPCSRRLVREACARQCPVIGDVFNAWHSCQRLLRPIEEDVAGRSRGPPPLRSQVRWYLRRRLRPHHLHRRGTADRLLQQGSKRRLPLYARGCPRAAARAAHTRTFSLHPRTARPTFCSGPDAARVGSQCPVTILGLRKNGEEFPAEASISALNLDHRILFVLGLRDVSGQEEVRRKLVQALDEQKFLAAIGEMFAFSLDPSETLRRVTQASVEFIADFLLVDLLVEGNLRRVKVACSDPAKADVARALEALPSDRFQPPPVWAAIENKQTVVWLTGDFGGDAPQQHTGRRGAFPRQSDAAQVVDAPVPLIVRDKAIGVMTFISSEPGRLYDPSRVRLAEEVARRAALALENSRLYKVTSDAVEARDQILSIVRARSSQSAQCDSSEGNHAPQAVEPRSRKARSKGPFKPSCIVRNARIG